MKRVLHIAAALVSAAALTVSAAACGGSSAAPADPSAYTAIIDVRTPAEFAEGHVEGAVNIDVQSPDFLSQIASLDPDGSYLVYCRSGRRSADAAERMISSGLTVVDGGGLGDMESAGWPFTN